MRVDLRAGFSSFSPLHSRFRKNLCKAHVSDRLVKPTSEITLRAIRQDAFCLFNISLIVRQIPRLGRRIDGERSVCRIFCRIAHNWFTVVRWPVPTLNTIPDRPGTSQAAKTADTQSAMKVKSRDCSPAP